MSYYNAQKCFDDAIRYIDPKKDPIMWDLANGLSALCQALQQDLHRLDQNIQNVESSVSRLK